MIDQGLENVLADATVVGHAVAATVAAAVVVAVDRHQRTSRREAVLGVAAEFTKVGRRAERSVVDHALTAKRGTADRAVARNQRKTAPRVATSVRGVGRRVVAHRRRVDQRVQRRRNGAVLEVVSVSLVALRARRKLRGVVQPVARSHAEVDPEVQRVQRNSRVRMGERVALRVLMDRIGMEAVRPVEIERMMMLQNLRCARGATAVHAAQISTGVDHIVMKLVVSPVTGMIRIDNILQNVTGMTGRWQVVASHQAEKRTRAFHMNNGVGAGRTVKNRRLVIVPNLQVQRRRAEVVRAVVEGPDTEVVLVTAAKPEAFRQVLIVAVRKVVASLVSVASQKVVLQAAKSVRVVLQVVTTESLKVRKERSHGAVRGKIRRAVTELVEATRAACLVHAADRPENPMRSGRRSCATVARAAGHHPLARMVGKAARNPVAKLLTKAEV